MKTILFSAITAVAIAYQVIEYIVSSFLDVLFFL